MKRTQAIERIILSSPHRLLVLLLLAFAGLGLTYAWATPCFESPDEWSHLSVVRYWAEHWTLPPRVLAPRDEPVEQDETWYFEYHDPPFYYAPPLYHSLAALLTSWTDMDDLPHLLVPSPSWERGWAPQPNRDPRNKNIYAHRTEETLAQSNTVRAAALLRAVSLGLAAVTVWCAYEMARLLWPDEGDHKGRPYVALGAASFVAFNPQFLALSIGVTNDNLLNALFALSLVWMLRFMRDGADWPRWAALGGLVGLALLTKQSALLLLPLGLLAAIWQPKNGRRTSDIGHWTFLIGHWSFLIVVGGWWYARNWALYRDPLGLETHFTSQLALTKFGLKEIGEIARSYWAAFGWAPLLVEPVAYAAAGLVMLAALAGILAAIRLGAPLWRAPAMTRKGLALLSLAFLLNVVSFARWAIATGVLSGRLLFATLPAVGVLTAWGLSGWSRWKVGRWALGVAAGLAFLFAAVVPFRYLRPAYGSPRLPSGMPDTAQPVRLTFQGDLQLAGYKALPQDLEPGEEINLTLYWHALAAPRRRYRTWAQLGPQDAAQKVAEYDTWLGGTLYPSDLWQAGDTVRQVYRLTVPDWTPAPGLYWFRTGLVDDETGTRLPLADRSSDMVVLGPWRVRATSPPPSPACAADFRLGPAIRLTGYDVEAQENSLSVTLYWQTDETPRADYTVFVHLADEADNLLGQHDGPPRNGAYPTSWWLPGDVVVDQHTIHLDEPLTTRAHLQIGMYDPATLARLPAYDSAGQRLPDDSIPLGEATSEEANTQCASD